MVFIYTALANGLMAIKNMLASLFSLLLVLGSNINIVILASYAPPFNNVAYYAKVFFKEVSKGFNHIGF